MKRYVALLSVLCLASGNVRAKSPQTSSRALKKSIKAYDIKQVKSGFEDLEDNVESKEELKEHLDDLIEVAQKAAKKVSSKGAGQSSTMKYAKIGGGSVLSLLGLVMVAAGLRKLRNLAHQNQGGLFPIAGNNTEFAKKGAIIVTSVGGGFMGLGGYLIWKGFKSGNGSSEKEAQEILEFLEDERDAL